MAGYKGKQGAKPKPTALKLLTGNPGHRPLPADEPQPAVGLPPPGKWLLPLAKRKYRQIGKDLLAARIVTRLDGDALSRYASVCERLWRAEDTVQQFGEVIMTKAGDLTVSPYLHIINKCHEQLGRLETEFGLTASSRSRLHMTPEQRKADPFAEFEVGNG